MFYRFFWVLPFACSVHGAVVRLHPDGSTPSGKTDPSTIKDCTYWANVQPGLLQAKRRFHRALLILVRQVIRALQLRASLE